MESIEGLTRKIVDFCEARDWKQFHDPKDLALSLVLEAAEVLEHFQWKSREEIDEYVASHKDDVGEELADVLYWVLYMSHTLGVDITEAFEKKMKKNSEKYPIEKSKGRHLKYDKL